MNLVISINHGSEKWVLRLFAMLMLLLWSTNSQAAFIDHFAERSDIGMAKAPNLGHSRLLVIPVNLDLPNRRAIDMTALRRFFTDDPDRFSFPGYWRVNSNGRLRISVDIAKPVNYSDCPFGSGNDCKPTRRDITALAWGIPLVREIIARAHSESGLDFARYDINGPQGVPDGWIDGLLIVMNGGWFGVALPFGIFDESLIVQFEDVKAAIAAISSGRRALGMSVHEYGHVLGFADLYDEWRNTYGAQLSPMGSWKYSMRDVPLLDAFSKMQIGWAEMEQVTGSKSILIPPSSTGKVYRLGRGREFFLVENRQTFGAYDRNIEKPGLSVTRINMDRLPSTHKAGFIKTVADCPNCRRWRPLVMNMQADRLWEIQYRLGHFDSEDLFRSGDAFLPLARRGSLSASEVWFGSNYLSGRPSEISITDIDSESMLPLIKATLSAPAIDRPCKNLRCPSNRRCLSGRCIAKDSKPEIAMNIHTQTSLITPAASRELAAAFAIGPAGCSLIDELDWRILSILLLIGWLLFRNKIRKRYQDRLRKKKLLDKDEKLKNRF